MYVDMFLANVFRMFISNKSLKEARGRLEETGLGKHCGFLVMTLILSNSRHEKKKVSNHVTECQISE